MRVRSALIALLTALSSGADQPCANPDYKHGISHLLPLHYDADYQHFDYANPAAPKGGRLRIPQMGTFDNFNNILEIGRMAAGYNLLRQGNLVYDRLLEEALDEPASPAPV